MYRHIFLEFDSIICGQKVKFKVYHTAPKCKRRAKSLPVLQVLVCLLRLYYQKDKIIITANMNISYIVIPSPYHRPDLSLGMSSYPSSEGKIKADREINAAESTAILEDTVQRIHDLSKFQPAKNLSSWSKR